MRKLITNKLLIAAILVVAFLALPAITPALTLTEVGAVWTFSYTEPSINADGSPLLDLKLVRTSYDIGAGWIAGTEILASSPIGGQVMSGTMEVPVTPGMEVDARFKANAFDLSGNMSADSNIVIKRIDRLAPGPPQ
jgi:hypothetical protein